MSDRALEKRWDIVAEFKRHPELSIRQLALKCGVHKNTAKRWIDRYKQHGHVWDQQRPGREAKVLPAVLAELDRVRQQKDPPIANSSSEMAQHIYRQMGVDISPRTVRRAIRRDEWLWQLPKQKPMLKPPHKRARLLWAQKHIRKRTCFSKWMYTDSKIFLLQKIGGRRQVRMWAPKGARPVVQINKCTKGIHVYAGLTIYGLTQPSFVTGANNLVSSFINPRTQQPYRGVCTREYVEQVMPKLIQGGNLLFATTGRWSSEWVYQQDNAPCHASAVTKESLQAKMPNRHEQHWPACSPDLSPIETVWALMERSLQRSTVSIKTVPELSAAIQKEFRCFSRVTCKKLMQGVPRRLERCVALRGAYIGK